MEYYFRIRPKDKPEVNGTVMVGSGKKLEFFVAGDDYLIEEISKKEAMKLKRDEASWKGTRALAGY